MAEKLIYKYFKDGRSLDVYDKLTRQYNINELKNEYVIKSDESLTRFTLLQIATYHNDINTLIYLFKNNVKINNNRHYKCSELYYAAKNNNYDIIILLIRHGATYNLWKNSSYLNLNLSFWENNVNEHLLTIVSVEIAKKLITTNNIKIRWYLTSYHNLICNRENTIDTINTLLDGVSDISIIQEKYKLCIINSVMNSDSKPEIIPIITKLKLSHQNKLLLFKLCTNETYLLELAKNINISYQYLISLDWNKINIYIPLFNFTKYKAEFITFLIIKKAPLDTFKLFFNKYTDIPLYKKSNNHTTLLMNCFNAELVELILEYAKSNNYDVGRLIYESNNNNTAYDIASEWNIKKVYLTYGYIPINKNNNFVLSNDMSIRDKEISYFVNNMNTEFLFHIDSFRKNILFYTNTISILEKLLLIGVPLNQLDMVQKKAIEYVNNRDTFLFLYCEELNELSIQEKLVLLKLELVEFVNLIDNGGDLNGYIDIPYKSIAIKLFGSSRIYPLMTVKSEEVAKYMFSNGADIHIPNTDWTKSMYSGGYTKLLILQCTIRGQSYNIETEWNKL
jgi:ankyrin repeat protein